MAEWQTKDTLIKLLNDLVEIPSVTGTDAEILLPEYIFQLLQKKSYFTKHPQHLQLHPLPDGRQFLTALVKQDKKKETLILLSHFDVVGTDDFGSFQNQAFKPMQLTETYKKHKLLLPPAVRKEISKGEWLFGRGVMDMKAGLAIHLSMLERAMAGEFDGNILLLTVPDEEVNSLGMLHALPVLQELKENESIDYRVCVNGEPVFSKYPGDQTNYVYTGSIGKVLPGFFCYGKETHVGEPFAGLNANLMLSYLSQELELHEDFIEKCDGEVTPPPVSLMQRDLKEEYSVQTPVAAVSMYNLLYLQQTIPEINAKLREAAERAADRIQRHYREKAAKSAAFSGVNQDGGFIVRTLLYEELYEEALQRFGKKEVERRHHRLMNERNEGDRDFSTRLVKELVMMCNDLAPMIVIFYSPPFYPSVSSKQDPLIQQAVQSLQQRAWQTHQEKIEQVQFFPGLSDLSFIGPATTSNDVDYLTDNMPLQHKGFKLPSDIMEAMNVPIINISPYGKDAHQWTERLEVGYSFEKLPNLLAETLQELLKEQPAAEQIK